MTTHVFKSARASLFFCIACLTMYTCVCVGRFSLSTAAAFIINEGIFDKSMLGLMNGLFYAFYGIGQIIFGLMGDRFSPLKLIGIGVGISAVANLSMAFTDNAFIMSSLWCLNGIGQATTFPCTINLISNMLIKRHRQKACMFLNFTYTASALLTNISAVYLTGRFTWQGIFVFSGGVLTALTFFWIIACLASQKYLSDEPDYEDAPQEQPRVTDGEE
ncbi:MAG: MFS transporter, partial [Oscillospiraceae bacterium]|nr:MFS transporter [Oscillospiraceae bacterium]